MPYATPDDLITWYGADELVGLAQADDLTRVSAALLRATLAGEERDDWTGEEQAAADQGVARIISAIDHAGWLMDSYLGQRYGLPLDDAVVASSPLPRLCGAVALHALSDDKVTEEVTRGYDRAVSWLRDMAAGKAILGGVVQAAPAPGGGGGLPRFSGGTKRGWSRT